MLLAASAPCCGLKDRLKNTSNAPALLTLSELTISRQHLQDMFCLCANPCHLLPALDWCPASFSEDAVGCSQQVTLPKTFMITSFSSIVLSLLRIPAFLWSLPMAALPSPPLLQSSCYSSKYSTPAPRPRLSTVLKCTPKPTAGLGLRVSAPSS